MTVLSGASIRRLCADPATSLVLDFDERQVRTASYDLRVGTEYFLSKSRLLDEDLDGGAVRIETLSRCSRAFEVGPNQVVIFRTLENVRMPTHLVGHLSLKLDVMLQGLILSNQSQIDAGYRGPIYCLLYNLSDRPVALHQGRSVIRLEFVTLDQAVEDGYRGDYKEDFGLADAVSESLRSSLQAMSMRVARLRRVSVTTAIVAAIAVAAIVYQLLGPLQGEASDARADARNAEDSVDDLEDRLLELESRVNAVTTTTDK